MSTILDHLDDVGTGWSPLLRDLHRWLVERSVAYSVGQIKEKFGGLRVYLDYIGEISPTVAWPTVQAKIAQVHTLSTETCEWCGAPGSLTETRWVKTLCPEHASEHAAGERERSFSPTRPLDHGTETEASST